jgi:outer membrane protein assembly factor BamA
VLAAVMVGLFSGCAGEKADGRPWVHTLTLEGVKNVSAGDLKKKLVTSEAHWYTTRRYLDPFTVDSDRQRVEAYYQQHGYFDAAVVRAEVTRYRGDAHQPVAVDVDLAVVEGAAVHVASVDVRGLEALGKSGVAPARDLRARLVPGAVFDYERYTAAKASLETAIRRLGYAWAKVDGVADVDRDAAQARFTLTVTPGPLASYGQVHIEGTRRVDPRLVALHTGITSGARYRPDDLDDARGQIYALGVFSSVQVAIAPAPGHADVADVIVTVQETTFNEVRVGGGFGLESQRTDAHASLTYTRNNWLGGLRSLRLRLEPAWVALPAFWNVQRQGPALTAEAQLIQPDIPWPLSELKLTLGYDVGIEYPFEDYGPRAQLALSRGFWRGRVRLGISYNFQLLQFFAVDPALLADPAQTGQLFGFENPYRLGWWQEDFALDLRDKPLDAHKGAYLGVSVEEGGVYAGGAFLYEKIVPDARGYIPLGSRVTVALRVQFGQIYTQGDLGSPVTRRFYLGGPDSHRGFNYDRLSRQVPSGIAGVAPIPIGGDQMLLAQSEVRVDLFDIAGNWLAIAGFVDGGDVGAPSCSTAQCRALYRDTNVDITNLHWAAGGGVRFKTIIGTLRFDVGVRLNRVAAMEPDGTPNPDPGQRVAYHLSVGEAF